MQLPAIAKTTLSQFHPHPSTATEKLRDPSIVKPVTAQDPLSNPCPEFINITREKYKEWSTVNSSIRPYPKKKVGYNFNESSIPSIELSIA